MWRHLSSMAELAGSAEFIGFGHHSGPPVPPPNILAGTLTTEVSYDLVGLRQDLSDQFSVPGRHTTLDFLLLIVQIKSSRTVKDLECCSGLSKTVLNNGSVE